MEFEFIKQLELELNNPSIRKDKKRLDELLSDDFEEIGKSGTKYTKNQIINELITEDNVHFSVGDFSFKQLSSDCILIKYKTTVNTQITHRCSVWQKQSGKWKIQYHQGTPIKHAT